jgi:RNA polymerase sigma-70 factor (ECF subfamily)
MASAAVSALAQSFKEDERFLWGLCYRLTGSAADADDLVQEAFVRALERPPRDQTQPLRPWLVRVALNLGRDLLRRRKRRRYAGPWLPSPIETGDDPALPAYEPQIDATRTTEGRYDLMESVSFAFLLALEALTPKQRAVLLLRDVFDYNVEETTAALGISAANVKTTHHRARAALAAYDRSRRVPTRELKERTRAALSRFVNGLLSGDVADVESMLAAQVRALSDGGGQYFAARKPLVGPQRVARFFMNIARRRAPSSKFEMRTLNGMPALIGEFADGHAGEPPRMVLLCDIDADGRITALHSVLADRKLTGIWRPAV